MAQSDDLTLQIQRVGSRGQFPDGSHDLGIQTNLGVIPGVLHVAEGSPAAVIWVSGALGGFNGPAHGLYPELARELRERGVSSFRITYRHPNEIPDCALDALGAVSVLKGLGATDLAIVGHSFGGAVAILAGALSPDIRAVIALSSQVFGTHLVQMISPRPLYLLHGTADERLPHQASEEIFSRARDPKQIVLVPGGSHVLTESRDAVIDQVRAWILDTFSLPKAPSPVEPDPPAELTLAGAGGRVEVRLTSQDLFEIDAAALVSPTNDQLIPDGSVSQRLVWSGGLDLAHELVQPRGHHDLGSVVPAQAGGPGGRRIFQAVIAEATDVRRSTDEPTIARVITESLRQADETGLRSIAFPAIGTGGGGLAYEQAARTTIASIRDYLERPTGLERIWLALPSPVMRRIYAEAAGGLKRQA